MKNKKSITGEMYANFRGGGGVGEGGGSGSGGDGGGK
jgi:hypothetical protein